MAKDTMNQEIMDILSPVLGEELAAAIIEPQTHAEEAADGLCGEDAGAGISGDRRPGRRRRDADLPRLAGDQMRLVPQGEGEGSRVDQQQYEKDDSGCRKRFPLR